MKIKKVLADSIPNILHTDWTYHLPITSSGFKTALIKGRTSDTEHNSSTPPITISTANSAILNFWCVDNIFWNFLITRIIDISYLPFNEVSKLFIKILWLAVIYFIHLQYLLDHIFTFSLIYGINHSLLYFFKI